MLVGNVSTSMVPCASNVHSRSDMAQWLKDSSMSTMCECFLVLARNTKTFQSRTFVLCVRTATQSCTWEIQFLASKKCQRCCVDKFWGDVTNKNNLSLFYCRKLSECAYNSFQSFTQTIGTSLFINFQDFTEIPKLFLTPTFKSVPDRRPDFPIILKNCACVI